MNAQDIGREATHGAALKARAQAMLGEGTHASINPYGDHDGIVVERSGVTVGYVEYNGQTWDAELPDEEGEPFATLAEALAYLTQSPEMMDAKAMILMDVVTGVVPANVASFSELHDYVDANGYFGDMMARDASPLADALDAWIKSGGITDGLKP